MTQPAARPRPAEHGPAARIFEDPKDPYTRALMAAAFDLAPVEGIVEPPPREDVGEPEF